MSEGQQDTRALFQARYVLTSLGVETRFTARGDALKGEIPMDLHPPVRNPVTGEALSHLVFSVDSAALLRIEDPPALRGAIARVPELVSLDRLLEHLSAVLEQRVSRASGLCERLQRMGLEASLDGERIVGVVRLVMEPEGTVTLEVEEGRLLARQLVPALGDRSPVSLGSLEIDLEGIFDRSDLEIALAEPVSRALLNRTRRSETPERREIIELTEAAEPAPAPAPPGQPPGLDELASHFGRSAFLKRGFSVGRPLMVSGEELRCIAEHRKGSQFHVVFRKGREALWRGDVDLDEIGTLEDFATRVLGGEASVHAVADGISPEASGETRHLVAGLLPPAPTETWVMDVRVEEDDGVEVRYRGLNVGGTTFGAPRVLPKRAFEASYLPSAGGFRMLIQVVSVDGDTVSYQRLDAERSPVGTPKESTLIVFLANFVAEASASY